MQRLITLLFLSFIAVTGFAQSFSVEQPSVTATGSHTANEFFTDIKIYNVTSSNLTIRWVRTQQIMPPTWRTSVCNDYYCFGMYDDSAAVTILPGDSDMVQMHFYPNNTPGSATIPVKLYDVNNPSDSTMITFYANTPVSVNENAKIAFELYPNPAADKLNITLSKPSKVLNVEIYNAIGQQVKSADLYDVQRNAQLNLSSLPAGYYFARIKASSGAVTVKKFVKE